MLEEDGIDVIGEEVRPAALVLMAGHLRPDAVVLDLGARPRRGSWATALRARVAGHHARLMPALRRGRVMEIVDPGGADRPVAPARAHSGRQRLGPVIEDAGSSHGTFVDGERVRGPVRLRDGARIRLGDAELGGRAARDAAEAGRTIVVPARRDDARRGAGAAWHAPARAVGLRAQAAGGRRRATAAGCSGTSRAATVPAAQRRRRRACSSSSTARASLAELIGAAEQRFGATGPARLARLLADLGERGFLSGVESTAAGTVAAPQSGSSGCCVRG